MYPRFIEVHEGGDPFSVNIDRITWIYNGTIKTEEHIFNVDESYENIKQLISEAGCLIHKADPRLDNKPLTADDFDSPMRGTPVWSSNTDLWFLVNYYDSQGVHLTDKNGHDAVWQIDDLAKYPLYRIKAAE